jgi:predicted metalloprotease with PDZ domain
VELRSRSDNRQSLDTVLAQFADCCLDPDPEWTARQVFDKFDELAGTDVFRKLYDSHVSATAFPDLAQLYADIGLEALGGKVELKSDAPRIDVRNAIMARGTYATPAALLR